jgi:hypothetical protein
MTAALPFIQMDNTSFHLRVVEVGFFSNMVAQSEIITMLS